MENPLQEVSTMVSACSFTLRHAALEYGMPKLREKINGRVLPGCWDNTPRYLEDKEEEEVP